MQGNLGRLHRFAQPMQEVVVILLSEEARFAIVPAQHHVQRLTREMDAGSAWCVNITRECDLGSFGAFEM